MSVSQQNGAEVDYCRVVGPRGLCRPLDEKQGLPTNISPFAPARFARKQGKGRPGPAGGVAPSDPPRKLRLLAEALEVEDQEGGNWQGRPIGQAQEAPGPWNLPAPWVWGSSLLPNSKRSIAWLGHYSPRKREALPSLTVVTRRSAGGLGRSLERPCKWSAALSAV